MSGPSLNTPFDGDVDQPLTVILSWDTLGGADDYQVQVAREATFAIPDFDGIATANSLDFSAQVDTAGYPLDFGETYYWRVRGRAAGVPGDWSDTPAFTTETAELPFIPNLDNKGDGLALLLQQFKGGI